jgi:hypothetical protein
MTVLELLELQARARAIRSQLAQEPVTKIELKSDTDDDDQQQQQPSSSSAPAAKRKTKSNSNSSNPEPIRKSQKETNAPEKPTTSKKTPPKPKPSVKRVKLKRNFRKREVGDEDSEPEEPVDERQPAEIGKEKEPTPPKEVEPTKVVAEQPTSDRSRDSSPEVIPMVNSPEVLCLSSESEGEAAEAFARRAREREKSSIFRTDYLESLEQKSKEYIDSLKKKNSKEPVVATVVVPPVTVVPETPADDPEEGEIQDDAKSPEKKKPEDVTVTTNEPNPEDVRNDSEKRRSDSSACLSVGLDNEELDYDKDESEKDESEKSSGKEQTNVSGVSEEKQSKSPNPQEQDSRSSSGNTESESEKENSSSSDSNEDDGDPKKKMKKQKTDERQDTTSPTEKEQSPQEGDEDEFIDLDTIEIHDSSDDGTCERNTRSKGKAGGKKVDSWNTRWLESSKVQKIIATSKLGNKVRGKLKKKKAKTVTEPVNEENSANSSPKADPSKTVETDHQKAVTEEQPEETQHEVGSVQHYQEILAKDQEKAVDVSAGEA